MSHTPSAELFPALTGDELVVVVALAPDVVALDVGLLSLGVGAPFADLVGNGLGA
jgi:hypothetical protein